VAGTSLDSLEGNLAVALPAFISGPLPAWVSFDTSEPPATFTLDGTTLLYQGLTVSIYEQTGLHYQEIDAPPGQPDTICQIDPETSEFECDNFGSAFTITDNFGDILITGDERWPRGPQNVYLSATCPPPGNPCIGYTPCSAGTTDGFELQM
jgi:hypothetical protein